MKLPAIPFLTKSVSTEYLLALVLESDKISSILFKEQEKTLKIIASNEKSIHLESASTEDLIVTSDNVISRSEMSLPEGANLEKTIFVTPYSWVEEGKIKPEKLSQLKKVSEELALVPMGFIVSIEAIIAYMKKKEGAPVNGIFVEIGEKILSVYIVRGDNIIDVQRGTIDESVEKSVERLLGNVTKLDVLPSKIILLHNKEAEEYSQRFLSHHWTKELSFLHLPQVTILEKNFENEAIINGVASQLEVVVTGKFEKGESDEEEVPFIPSGSEDFGFAAEEDVAKEPEREPEISEKEIKEDDEDFEFSSDTKSEPKVHHSDLKQEKESEEPDEEVFEEDIHDKESSPQGIGGSILAMVSSFLTPRSVSKFLKSFGNARRFIIPFAALVVVVILLISYYSFMVKAKVTVFTDQKAFSENAMDINLTSTKDSSYEDKLLRIKTIDEKVDGEQSQETTGTKDTGQKATGTITLFNKSESPKSLEKGTTVTSSNNLEFTLDDNVNIASTSSFATSYSSTNAKITASSFGKEYNLPSQTNFTVKGVSSSDMFGKNDQAFSGGSKEQIQVVSKKDLQSLEDSLVKRLFDKAKSQAQSSVSEGDALIPSYLTYDFDDKKFDKKENDQAKSVNLTATITYSLGSYNKDDLSKFISSSREFDVPEDFKLSDSESTLTISDISQNGKNLSAKVSFKAVFKPQLDENQLPKLVAGKGTNEAVKKLKEVKGVSDVTIQYENTIPFLPKIVPLNKSNISLEFKTQ